jgi:hypothetical protein
MTEVAIVTMHDVRNCGSMLQAYATQRAVEQFGFNASIIDYRYPNLAHPLVGSPWQQLKRNIKHVAKTFLTLREKLFQQFVDEHMHLTRRYHDAAKLREDPPTADVYVTGSDQVWNPRFIGTDEAFFLGFAPNGCRRVAYAPSFGSHSIPSTVLDSYREYLTRYHALSARESSGADIIERLTGSRPPVVVDPTFLVERTDWENLAVKPPIKRNYILCYGMDEQGYLLSTARKIQEETGHQIVRVYGNRQERARNNDVLFVRDVGPREFLGLFQRSSFAVARSLHGTIFSLIFERPFLSIYRGDTTGAGARQVGLLQLLGLVDRGIAAGRFDLPANLDVDYAAVRLKINHLCNLSRDYLKDAIGSR